MIEIDLSTLEKEITYECRRKNISEDKVNKFIQDVVEYIITDLPKYFQRVIDEEYINKGMLKEGWIVKFQDEAWRVSLVNNSRCHIECLSDASKQLDISPYSEIIILMKPDE